jgi:hypothetical protein
MFFFNTRGFNQSKVVIIFKPGISIGYSTIETKEAARIGYNGFLFQHEYSGEGRIYNSFAGGFIVQI